MASSVIQDLKHIQGENSDTPPPFPFIDEDIHPDEKVEWFGTTKAMALDLVSPIIFARQTQRKLFDLSKTLQHQDLDRFPQMFWQRVIPLNKAYPNVPKRGKFRPIVISSHLFKLIESKFSEELRQIVQEKIMPCQTGFIPGSTVFVNINRAVTRIKHHFNHAASKACYGIFIDLSNAYNTVNRDYLFSEVLPNYGMAPNRIGYLNALYSRCTLK